MSSQDQNAVHGVGWGVVLTGTAGVVRVDFGIPQDIRMRHREGDVDTWLPLPGDPFIPTDTMDTANQRLVDDLMSAIASGGGLVVCKHASNLPRCVVPCRNRP